MDVDQSKRVLENEFLLGEIIHRVGSSKSLIRASCVNRFWLGTARSVCAPALFLRKNKQSFLGFIVETQDVNGRALNMLFPGGAGNNETVLAMRAGYDHAELGSQNLVATAGPLALHSVVNVGDLPVGYHVSSPFSRPRDYRYAGFIIPKIPKESMQYTPNTFGQYGVIMQTRRTEDSPMGFFVKDPAGNFAKLYQGISFGSREPVYVHVSVLRNQNWTRFISEPIELQSVVTFHRNPYCVLVGKRLFMMYLVGCIICFHLETEQFELVSIPAGLDSPSTSWFDYTVASGENGTLALVHLSEGLINRWILDPTAPHGDWILDYSFNIMEASGGTLNVAMQALLIIRGAQWGTVQLRGASQGARFIMVTFGMNEAIFIIDLSRRTSIQLPNVAAHGMVGRVFAVGEQWPPAI